MALIKIDGVDMPDPYQYTVPMGDLDSSDSAHSESGIRFRNRIRQGITRLELGWRINGEDAATLLAAIEPSMVNVEYLDPRMGIKTANMSVEDRSCSLLNLKSSDDPNENLWEIGFNLVEY